MQFRLLLAQFFIVITMAPETASAAYLQIAHTLNKIKTPPRKPYLAFPINRPQQKPLARQLRPRGRVTPSPTPRRAARNSRLSNDYDAISWS